MKDEIPPSNAGIGPKHLDLHASKTLRQQVFEYVRAEGRTARADVTRALEISPGSATTLTADLIGAGVLHEVEGGPRESGRGRPPVALEVVPDAHFVVGIKLSDEKHTAVLTDFAGNIIADAALPVSAVQTDLTQRVDEVETLLNMLLDTSGKTRAEIKAMGVGMSGIIDHDEGTSIWSPLLKDSRAPVRDALFERMRIPVEIDNDTNILAMAELWFGVGRTMSDFVVVTIENGVGMGLVIGNQLYRGMRGMGMELGHTKVQLDGALCRCGKRGCLEAYLADYALTREAATALNMTPDADQSSQAVLATLYAKAKDGDASAQSIFRRAGRFLSVGLSNVIQLFDPELIILSGERMQYDYLYADAVITEMQSLALSDGRAHARVEVHAWGDLVWARGATALALSSLTDRLMGAEAWTK